MKHFLLLLMVAFTLGSCEIYDRVDELELTADALTKEDGYLSAALVEANIALADATALLEAAIAENAQLSADNAALIAANMTEVDIKLAEIIASDELTAQEISDLEASVSIVKEDVMAYVDAQIDALQTELTAAIADGDKDAINKLQADIDAAIAAGLRGEDGTDGQDGQDGAPGQAGQAGQDGTPGQDGAPGADGTGSGTSYDDTAVRALISSLESTINGLGAHTDISSLVSQLEAIEANLAGAVDNDTVYNDAAVRALIETLSNEVTTLANALANANIDAGPDYITYSPWTNDGGVIPGTAGSPTKVAGSEGECQTDGNRSFEQEIITTGNTQNQTRTATVTVVGLPDAEAPIVDLPLEQTIAADDTSAPTVDGSESCTYNDQPDTYSAYGSYSPAYTNQTANFVQTSTRTVETVNGVADTNPVLSQDRTIIVTGTAGNTDITYDGYATLAEAQAAHDAAQTGEVNVNIVKRTVVGGTVYTTSPDVGGFTANGSDVNDDVAYTTAAEATTPPAGYDFTNAITVILPVSVNGGDVSIYDANGLTLHGTASPFGANSNAINFVFPSAGTYTLSFFETLIKVGTGNNTTVSITINTAGVVSFN